MKNFHQVESKNDNLKTELEIAEEKIWVQEKQNEENKDLCKKLQQENERNGFR